MAFYELSKKYHPDHNRKAENQEKVNERFRKYAQTYEVLRDRQQRKSYDPTGDYITYDIDDLFSRIRNNNNDDITIGIDLGTTFSVVGVYDESTGKVNIIPNDLGNRLTPSCVAFTLDGRRLIGEAAVNQQVNNPENTVCNVKRLIGRGAHEREVKEDIANFPYTVISGLTTKGQVRTQGEIKTVRT